MICFHHSDFDGRAAASLVARCHPNSHIIEVDYATRIPWAMILREEPVFILDFSLQQPGDWARLLSITTNVTWIDHHETAIQRAPEAVHKLRGTRDTSMCGALLTWLWMCSTVVSRGLMLIDSWDRHGPTTEDICAVSLNEAFTLYDPSPRHQEFWDVVLWGKTNTKYGSLEDLINTGTIASRYSASDNRHAIRNGVYTITWEGHEWLVLNTHRSGSIVFESVPIHSQREGFICWRFVHDRYTVHLYSDKFKVNEIAARHGGGGHPGAAGFVCERLPWTGPLNNRSCSFVGV